jgi:hypothetical protein
MVWLVVVTNVYVRREYMYGTLTVSNAREETIGLNNCRYINPRMPKQDRETVF